MIFEAEVFVRDTIKFNVLKELLTGNVTLAVQMNNGTIEDYASQIHNDKGRVRVYGNFNMSESPDGETLTIRPVTVDSSLRAVPAMSGDMLGKSITLVRSATKTEENIYPFDNTFMGFELVPSNDKYILRLEYSDNIQQSVQTLEETVTEIPIQTKEEPVEEISDVQNTVPENVPELEIQPQPKSQTESERMHKIGEEYKKDYDSAQNEVEEYKKRFEVDSAILEYYKDKDVKPIEDIFREISEKLDEAEKQIALFIQAKQKKTMDIEGDIKSNK